MHSPEHILFHSKWFYICLHCRADKAWKHVTWGEKLNPLRYQISLFPRPYRIHINRGGMWRVKVSNFFWPIYRHIYKGGKYGWRRWL